MHRRSSWSESWRQYGLWKELKTKQPRIHYWRCSIRFISMSTTWSHLGWRLLAFGKRQRRNSRISRHKPWWVAHSRTPQLPAMQTKRSLLEVPQHTRKNIQSGKRLRWIGEYIHRILRVLFRATMEPSLQSILALRLKRRVFHILLWSNRWDSRMMLPQAISAH